jgi:gluconate 2-dehydrogenase gamma chain
MQRRDVLKLLSSVAALSALPQEALALLAQANQVVAHHSGVRTLSPHQDATVTTIAELIIPETDTPGAKVAKVNEFIDLLLTEWYEPAATKQFLSGLSDVDARSKKQFSKDFVSCSADQQAQLLKALDAEAMDFAAKQRATVTNGRRSPLQQTTPPPSHFFYTMKKLTLTGYYTSQIGFSKELGRYIIPPEHSGCATVKISGVAR